VVPGIARTLAGDYITSVGSVGDAAVEKDLTGWIRIIGALVVACALGSASAEDQGQLTPGEHKYEFSGWNGPPIDVLVFIPDKANETTPVLMVMHGWSRAAQRYFDDWKALGEQQEFIVVVPHFPVEDFHSSHQYNLGHVFDQNSGKMRPVESWTFAAIEPLFDDVISRSGSQQTQYTLYGHSAGSQFVHRFLYYMPDARVKTYLAANAGWYTMPDFDAEYPYGLQDAAIDEDGLKAAFGKELVLLLSREDTDFTDPDLRNTPEAKRQGKNRLARGLTMYYVAKTNADKMNAELKWRVVAVEGADHNNAKMAPAAAKLIE
jgi:pimeloyl-ACP methyl ester carboxylesterase